jgi:hypothetical protein
MQFSKSNNSPFDDNIHYVIVHYEIVVQLMVTFQCFFTQIRDHSDHIAVERWLYGHAFCAVPVLPVESLTELAAEVQLRIIFRPGRFPHGDTAGLATPAAIKSRHRIQSIMRVRENPIIREHLDDPEVLGRVSRRTLFPDAGVLGVTGADLYGEVPSVMLRGVLLCGGSGSKHDRRSPSNLITTSGMSFLANIVCSASLSNRTLCLLSQQLQIADWIESRRIFFFFLNCTCSPRL